jgi:hypothetical protein
MDHEAMEKPKRIARTNLTIGPAWKTIWTISLPKAPIGVAIISGMPVIVSSLKHNQRLNEKAVQAQF